MSLTEALSYQAVTCDKLGSPFMGQLLRQLAENLRPGTPLTDRLFTWPGELGPRGASVPLRLAGGLHALVLTGQAPALAALYPPNAAEDDALWAEVARTLDTHAAFLGRWIDSPPQTNEVARSACLIPLGHWLTDRFGLPITLSEIGASAGLNLFWDRYALQAGPARLGPDDAVLTIAPEWRGRAPIVAAPTIAARRGVDLNPLDVGGDGDRLRLRAYLWPDQPDRMARLEAALGVAEPLVDGDDGIAWLRGRLGAPQEGVHLIYTTVAWQYLTEADQATGTALIEAAGARATPQRPLAWFGMENDGDLLGAGMHLRLWPGDHKIPFGRIDFHGRWVDWQPGA